MRGGAVRCLKVLARRCLETDPIGRYRQIASRIDDAHIVSFDIFDTLLKRDVKLPSDVFRLCQEIYESSHAPLGLDFCQSRISAEEVAYLESDGDEISLDDIYDQIPLSLEAKDRLAGIEQRVELAVSTANGPVKELYRRAVLSGKRVVFISDMYLPRALIEKMLSEAGYTDYERLFLSSDIGLRKASGKMFPHVIRELDTRPEDILHIGDSLGADYIQARKAKVSAVLIPRDLRTTGFRNPFGKGAGTFESVGYAAVNNLTSGKGYFYSFGAMCLGPVLYGLVRFIREGMEQRGQRRIYFMARDGFLVKQAFNILYPEMEGSSRYLYASRRSFGIPSIYTEDDLIEVGPTTRLITVERFLVAVGLSPEEAAHVARGAGFSEGERITKLEMLDDARFKKMCSLAFPIAADRAREQRTALIDYLSQEGVGFSSAVFDLGWAGNIQGFLNRLLRHEMGVEDGVFGYYLGLDPSKRRRDIECSSYLGASHPDLYLELVELCFSSQEGSTVGFVATESGSATPVLSPYEYDDMLEKEHILEIQKGALDYIRRFKELDGIIPARLDPASALSGIMKVGTEPSRSDLIHFAAFRFEDNGEYVKLADPRPLPFYLLHPMRFLEDFESARWKPGFSKLLFKLPLPYYRLLRAVKDAIKRNRS